MNFKKEVLLFTAGLDSFLAREYLTFMGHDIECVYFNIDTRYSNFERDIIKKYHKGTIIDNSLTLGDIEQDDAFVPNRNILLTILAASKYSDIVWIGGTLSDRVCDNNKEVFDELSKFLSIMNSKSIKISSPFWGLYKTNVIQWYRENCGDSLDLISERLLNQTFSCFTPLSDKVKREAEFFRLVSNSVSDVVDEGVIHYDTYECHNCPACFRKSVELNSIGIFRPFTNQKIVKKYSDDIKHQIILNDRMKATQSYIQELCEKRR